MKIAIFGAGVAGASCALALARHGHDVAVFERRETRQLGAGVVLWSNAIWIARQWGIEQAISARGGHPKWMARLTEDGLDLGRLPVELIDAALGTPSTAILRTDLIAVLHEAARAAGAVFRFGAELRQIVDEGSQAMAILDDGSGIKADLIIGAEGRMRSPARRYVAPEFSLVHGGFANWVGIADFSDSELPQGVLDLWGRGKRFGVVPVGKGRAYWAAGLAVNDSLLAPSVPIDDLLEAFGGWPDPVHRILEASPDERLRTIDLYDLEPLPRWHRRNVVLVGDAAHAALPTSGQGACQAFEDAWHLSRLLTPTPASLDHALKDLFDRRAAKTARIAHAARQFAGALFATDDAAVRARNTAALQADTALQAGQTGAFWALGLDGR